MIACFCFHSLVLRMNVMWFWVTEHSRVVDMVLLYLPSCMESPGNHFVSTWRCRNDNSRAGVRRHGEGVSTSYAWLWRRDDWVVSSSACWIQRSVLLCICCISQIPQFPKEMISSLVAYRVLLGCLAPIFDTLRATLKTRSLGNTYRSSK